MKNKVFIIAEAGVNHNGSIKKAIRLIDIAANAGANAVKFQITNAELITKKAQKADYQKVNSKKNKLFIVVLDNERILLGKKFLNILIYII